MATRCEECAYFVYDDEYEEYMCEINLDEDEVIEVEAYTLEELCDMIYAGKIEDSKTIAAIMSYKNLR